MNLIVSAAHAIEEANATAEGDKLFGKIGISCAVAGRNIEIKVKDTGTGIPVELHLKVFDRFSSSKKVGKGTGQELSISHNLIVGGHGASISFETEAGVGTTFSILLPTEGKQT